MNPSSGITYRPQCTACHGLTGKGFIRKYPTQNFKLYLDVPVSALQEAATSSSGCPICKFLWRAVTAVSGKGFHKEFHTLELRKQLSQNVGPLSGRLHVQRSLHDDPALQFYVYADFRINTSPAVSRPFDEPSWWPDAFVGEDIMPYGLSESCIQKAKQWLHDCTGAKGLEHTSCPPFVSSPLPTRTISIGKADQDLRLHISEPGEVAPYFSLSHCWGGKSCLTLSRDTLNDYVNDGIPFEKLPQTFRDAVSVTRALGVSYLWIDSLCIIQDSKEDWEAEAALMARVYENAQITIAAHAANDSTTGFLNAPARRPPRTTSVPFEDGSGLYNVRVRECGNTVREGLPWHVARGDAYSSSKLSSRGWVYQESLLAPRTLNFAATEMAWECHSITACECGAPQVELDHEKEVETGRRYPGTIKRNFAKLIWTDVVHEYTLRDLTVATDRLPALSGVVELFSRHRPEDQYLYGLWKTELPQHLCWLAAEPNQEARFPKSYAPTWSWASLQSTTIRYSCSVSDPTHQGPVSFKDFKVLEIYHPAPHQRMGDREAYLKVSAPVLSVKVTVSEFGVDVLPIRLDESPGGANLYVVLDCTSEEFLASLSNSTQNLALCLILEYLERDGSGHSPPFGILLRQVGNQDVLVFERIGCAFPMIESKGINYQGWVELTQSREFKFV